jgi:hypothetical protein
MKFREPSVHIFAAIIEKIERYYAYKYQVPKSDVSLLIKNKIIHILISGKVKESILPALLLTLAIREEDGYLKGPKR